MSGEQLPVLQDTNQRLDEWRKANAEKQQVERFIGTHRFSIEGVEAERIILPYSLWMFQRPIDYYHELSDKTQVNLFLHEMGFGNALQQALNNRLVRRNNILEFE